MLERSPCHHADVFEPDGFDWDRVAVNARLDLARIDNRLTDRKRVQRSVVGGADRIIEIQRAEPWAPPYAPDDGWDWGSNGRILNNLVVLATAYDTHLAAGVPRRHALRRRFPARPQRPRAELHHRLRHRPHVPSTDPPLRVRPRSRISASATRRDRRWAELQDVPRVPVRRSAAGAPPQLCYLDEPTSETTNDVCIRWNAPLVWVAMFLAQHPG